MATMRFNQLNPPFDNPAIRRALLGAVEQSDYMTGMVGTDETLWHVQCGVFTSRTRRSPPMPGWRCSPAKRDPAKVKRDLEAAGYQGEKVVLLTPTDIAWSKALADITADTLRHLA